MQAEVCTHRVTNKKKNLSCISIAAQFTLPVIKTTSTEKVIEGASLIVLQKVMLFPCDLVTK